MPVGVIIEPERQLIISEGWGVVTGEELLASREDLQKDPDFDPSFDRIWDLSGTSSLDVSDETTQFLAGASLSLPHVRRAIVCGAPATISRVLDLVSRSRGFLQDVAIFPTREEAIAWIKASYPRAL